MRLFTPQEAKKAEGNEIALDVLRAKEAKDLLNDIVKQRIKAEAEYKEALARNLESWAKEEEEHQKEVKRRELEIQTLEEKKLNELIPFGILKEGTDDRFREAQSFLMKLREREAKAEELCDTFEDKLDELGDREQALAKNEQLNRFATEGIERQREDVLAQAGNLTKHIADFVTKQQEDKELFIQKDHELIMRERTLDSKEESYKEKERTLGEWDTRLHQERETLDAAWKELERKK